MHLPCARMSDPTTPAPRRWRRWALLAGAIVVAAGIVVAVVIVLHRPGNVSHPDLSFTRPATTTTPAPIKPKKMAQAPPFLWPRYGYDAGRTRGFPASPALVPPFRIGWSLEDYALLEFPPVIEGSTLYDLDDDGSAKAIDALTGHIIWQHKIAHLAAASPAVDARDGLLIVPTLSDTGSSPGNGQIAALSLKTGRQVWSHALPSGSESSPIVYGRTLYFGDTAGTVFSMDSRNGHVNWTYQASGAVKGGPALADGILYFGDYAGRAYAVNARTGHQVWAVSTDGAHFGFGSGNFYATPAVAFGRVYLGNTDGFVYSFAARTGQVAWATATGAYVYASAAVADVKGLGPTVYIGSYDGNLYAFNAQSGAVRWRHPAGGRISGAATIVNGVVYYSDLGTKTTTGLNARTGQVVFSFPDGAFNPVIAAPDALYLDGVSKLYELLPKSRPAAAPRTHRRSPRRPARRRSKPTKHAARRPARRRRTPRARHTR